MTLVDDDGLGEARMGTNLASAPSDWKNDYRCPDVVVFLNNSSAICHGPCWTGGPNLAVEIVSPDDETRQKFGFYAKVGTEELLVVDRNPWRLELLRNDGVTMGHAAFGELNGDAIACESLPINLRLMSGEKRPQILVTHTETGQEWVV